MNKILFLPTQKEYKDPVGACLVNSNIHFQIAITKEYNIWDLKLHIEKDGSDDTILSLMHYAYSDDYYNHFEIDFRLNSSGLYFYCFEFCDVYGTHYISKDENLEAVLSDKKENWQLLIHNEFLGNLDWFKGKIMYQIMVDRFYDGGVSFVKDYAIVHKDWSELPNYKPINGKVLNNDFFGGDLKGIIAKLDYLKSLNVGVILLNPIFTAYSNHKYDTSDYMQIDPMFGDDMVFTELCKKAKEKGISIILDGVFNHTGSDSVYFNKFNRFNSIGAYQSKQSPYYSWYFFKEYPDKYECWWNFDTLPKVNQLNPTYIDFICGDKGVVNKWISLGARGFRLDVVDEYEDCFVDELNKAVKKSDPNNILLGEVWEDASNKIAYSKRRSYFSGKQLDSVMNYPFRNAIIDLVNNRNVLLFRNRIRSIINNYPKHVLDSLMNVLGTHDTIRALNSFLEVNPSYMSKDEQANYKISQSEYYLARHKLVLASIIQYTLPGIPSLYYGDEAGVSGFVDPLCRKTYPWGKEDQALLEHYKKLGEVRKNPLFTSGDYQEEFIDKRIFIYSRSDSKSKIYVIINLSDHDTVYRLNGINLLTGETYKDIAERDNISLIFCKKE